MMNYLSRSLSESLFLKRNSRSSKRRLKSGQTDSNSAYFNIELLENRLLLSNQSPLNVVPGAQSTQENTPLAFTAYQGNAISVSDPDAGLNPVEVTLSAVHGTLTLTKPDPNGGLNYLAGDGTDDTTMTFVGKLSDINEALQWLVFRPDADYVGTEASLTITTNDQGYLGTGGPQSDTDTIAIEVTAVPAFAASPVWTTFPGALDPTFDEDGIQTLSVSGGIDYIHDMQLLDSGKILGIGAVNNHYGMLRFNADLTLDDTFGTNGVVETDLGAGRHALTHLVDNQGRILLGGLGYVARYLPDGTLDTTFGTDGSVRNTYVEQIHAMAIQPDGKILVAGRDGTTKFRITRYFEDGTVDMEFNYRSYNPRSSAEGDYVRGLTVQGDGDILLIGRGANPTAFSLVRIDTNGIQEAEYAVDFPDDNEFIHDVLELPDGKVLVVGCQGSGDAWKMAITRHHFDGTLDTSFGTDGLLTLDILSSSDEGYRATLQSDGKILVTGHSYNGSNWDLSVARLSYDGVLDATFDGDGKLSIPFSGNDDFGHGIVSMPDGRIVIAGRTGDDIALVRLLGDSDQSSAIANIAPFNAVPGSQSTQVNTPLAFTDYRGNLISVSDSDAGLNPVQVTLSATHGTLTLINADPNGGLAYSAGDGTEDTTMTFTGKLTDINEALQWLVFRPDADYVGTDASVTITTNDQGYLGTGGPQSDTDTIAIEVTAVPAFAASPVWTTFPGALDTTFDEDGMQTLSVSGGIDYIHDMQLLDSGKILAVGAVNNHYGLLRFNADLTLDDTFGTNGVVETDLGAGRHAYTLHVDDQQRIFVGGYGYLARYSADGVLDTTFGTEGIVENSVVERIHGIAIQPDGKVLAMGRDNSYFRITRYLEDGTLDPDFEHRQYNARQPSQGFNGEYGRGLTIRDDGDILLIGKGYPGAAFSLVRINTYGDRELDVHIDFPDDNEFVHDALELPDGKVLLVGYQGSGSNQELAITRHHFDGTLDTTFGIDGLLTLGVLNANDEGARATLQPDGKILVMGHSYNGSNWDLSVVRLSYDGVLDSTFDGDGKLSIPFSGNNDFGHGVVSMPDGRIVIAGRTGDDIALVRLLGDSDQSSAVTNVAPDEYLSGYLEVVSTGVSDWLGITSGDLNLDGVTDLALMKSGVAQPILLSRAPGDADLIDSFVVDTAYSPKGIGIGDVNNDQIPDILVSKNHGGVGRGVVPFLGDGLGTFTESTDLSNGGYYTPNFVEVADFNNDQIEEIVTSNYNNASDGGVSVIYTDGTVIPLRPWPDFRANGYNPVLTDLNRDGYMDIAVPVGDPEEETATGLAIMLNDQSGSFTQSFVERTDSSGQRYADYADLNGDGAPEILVADSTSGSIHVYLNDGNGAFTQTTDSMFLSSVERVHVLGQIGESTGLFVAGVSATDGVTIFRYDGTSGWTVQEQFAVNGSLSISGDFDGSGTTDLAVLDSVGDLTFLYFEINIPPTLHPVSNLTIDEDALEQTVELTGITAGGGEAQPLRVAATSSNPELVSNIVATLNPVGYEPVDTFTAGNTTHGVATGDFDGDGHADVAVVNQLSNNASVMFGDGEGQFTTPISTSIGSQPYFVVADDFDGDGLDDIVASNFESNTVTIRLGKTDRSFSPEVAYPTGDGSVFPASTGAWYMTTGDFNNDGRRDLVISNIRHDFVSVLLGDGAGGFGSPLKIAVGPAGTTPPHQQGPYGLVAADFNQDGHDDIAVAVKGADVVRILTGDGAGNFSVTSSYDVGDSPRGLTIADFNNDGSLDLGVANQGDATVTLLLGDGAGIFSPLAAFPAGANSTELTSGDLDLDGNADLLVSAGAGKVYRLLGSGDGSFAAPEEFTTGNQNQSSYFTVLEDFNQDGFLDVATALNQSSQTGAIGILLSEPATGSLAFTPVRDAFGTATITVTVEDGGFDGDLDTPADNATFSRTFEVTVNPVNDLPTMDAINDLMINESAPEQTLSLTGITAGGGEDQPLSITAISSNPEFIPNPTVTYTSPASTGNLAFTPVTGVSGVATITVSIEDGGLDADLGTTGDNATITRTFDVSVRNFETASLRVVHIPTGTDGNGETDFVPANQDWVSEWEPFWGEIWVSTEDLTSQGIATVSLDLGYETGFTSATEIEYGPAFSQNQAGTINDLSGLITNLTAATNIADLGVDRQLLFARIKFESLATDQVLLDLEGQSIGPHDLGLEMVSTQFSLRNERVNGDPQIDSAGADIWANPYDLNDDDAISFRDLIVFASVYGSVPSESGSDYAWASDFNQNHRVEFKDLILFAANYGKAKVNQPEVTYPDNYPTAWNNQLQVSILPQTEVETASLTQSQADRMLQTAVQTVSPDLTPDEQQRLQKVNIEVVDLGGSALGRSAADTIYIDVNAAGYGWFIDETPFDHSEFQYDSQLTLIALPGSEAAGLIDLWTVIRHELGHLLGYEHTDEGLMEAVLDPGHRKLPEWADETDQFFASLEDDTELLSF